MKIRENPLSTSIYEAVTDVLGLRDKVEELIENESSPAKPKEVAADTSPKPKPVIDFVRKPIPVSALKSEKIENVDKGTKTTTATQTPSDKKAVEVTSVSQPKITKPKEVIVDSKKIAKEVKPKAVKETKADKGDKKLKLDPSATTGTGERKLKLDPTAGVKDNRGDRNLNLASTAKAVIDASDKKLKLDPTATAGVRNKNLDLSPAAGTKPIEGDKGLNLAPTAGPESVGGERELKLDASATAGVGDRNLDLSSTAGTTAGPDDKSLNLAPTAGTKVDAGEKDLNLASTSGAEPAMRDKNLDLASTAGAESAEVERKLKLDPSATVDVGDRNLDLSSTAGTKVDTGEKDLNLASIAGAKPIPVDKDLNLASTSEAVISADDKGLNLAPIDSAEPVVVDKNLDLSPNAEPQADASIPKDVDVEPDISHYEKRRRSLGAVNTDLIEKRAQDLAAERMTAEKDSLKGLSGYFKKIWKHNWGADYYRAKEVRKIKNELMSSGSAFSESDTSGSKDREIKESILKRFLMDAPELIHFDAGESVGGVPPEKKAQAESLLQEAIKNYASSSDPAQAELDFKAERDRIYSEIFKNKDGSFNAINVADNVFEFAKEIRGQVEHGKALSDLDLDFELTLGNAKTGVRTEEHYSWVDKRVKELSSTWVGRFFNETTIAAGVSTALILTKIGTGKGARAAMGLAGGVVLASGIAGVRENQAIKRDRAEHSRAMASGRTFDPSRAPRRAELEASSYNMLNAKTEKDDLHNMLFETVGGLEREKVLGKNEIDSIMARISQIDSRIALSDKGKIDLIGFSDESMIEVERTNLDLERYKAKIMLKDAFAKDSTLGSFEDKMNALNKVTEDLLVKGQGGINERDAVFNKLKRKRVIQAMATGAVTGITFGVVGQEVASFWNEQQGVVEGVMGKGGSSGKVTSLEWAREKIAEAFGMNRIPQGVETVLPGKETLGTALVAGVAHDMHTTVNSFISLPEGYELNPAGNKVGVYDVFLNGKSVVSNIEIDQSTGNFTANSLASLEKAGFHMNTSVDNVASSVTSGAVAGGKAVNVQDFANEHSDKLAKIKRLGWADNGTVRPDKNELKLWDPVEKNGHYEYAVKMNSSGSTFNGRHIDPVELAKEGKLKALFSLSHSTQGHPVEVPIKYEGGKMTFDVDPKDPILGQLFHKAPNGEIICDARYVEVGVEMGSKNGVKEFVMCATEEGKGVKTINAGGSKIDDYLKKNVNIKIEMPKSSDIVLPPVIPLVPRTPLEKTKEGEQDKDKKINKESDKVPKLASKEKTGASKKASEGDKKSSTKKPADTPEASPETALDLSKLSEEENKKVSEIISNEISYQDSELTDELKRKTLEWAKTSESSRKYSEALVVMNRKWKMENIEKLANDMVKKCQKTLADLGISSSTFGKSKSWAMWDIGKQFYFFAHKDQADTRYTIGNPMDSVPIQKEIIDRHVGWEVYGAFRKMNQAERQLFLDKFKGDSRLKITALLNKVPKPNNTLSSLDLTTLGNLLARGIKVQSSRK